VWGGPPHPRGGGGGSRGGGGAGGGGGGGGQNGTAARAAPRRTPYLRTFNTLASSAREARLTRVAWDGSPRRRARASDTAAPMREVGERARPRPRRQRERRRRLGAAAGRPGRSRAWSGRVGSAPTRPLPHRRAAAPSPPSPGAHRHDASSRRRLRAPRRLVPPPDGGSRRPPTHRPLPGRRGRRAARVAVPGRQECRVRMRGDGEGLGWGSRGLTPTLSPLSPSSPSAPCAPPSSPARLSPISRSSTRPWSRRRPHCASPRLQLARRASARAAAPGPSTRSSCWR